MTDIKNVKLGAILGILLSLIIFAICLVYLVVGNLSVILFTIVTIYALLQVFIFIVTSLLYLKYNKLSLKIIFRIGILLLFALFAPGIIILLSYFKEKKKNYN